MVSSAASQIESTAGKHLHTTLNGSVVEDLAKVQGILIGTVAIFTIIMVLLGSENHGAHFEQGKVAFEGGGGEMREGEGLDRADARQDGRRGSGWEGEEGKEGVEHVEKGGKMSV